jgi:hypothetical protein
VKRSGREGRWADIPSARIRFALEAAFLVLVAAGAAIARLSPAAIIIFMLVAWLLVALIERASSREQAGSLAPEDEAPAAAAVEEAGQPAEIRPREGLRLLFWRRPRPAQPLAAPARPLEERPSRAHVRRIEPEAPIIVQPPVEVEIEIEITETVVTEALRGPAVTKRPLDLPGLEEPEPSRAAVPPSEEAAAAPPAAVEAPLPPPPPEPTPVPPTPPPAPQPPPPRPPAREWNLWDLESRAREHARDPARDEEWSALFVHLREFANPDGALPKEFDDLVRESFSELIQAA